LAAKASGPRCLCWPRQPPSGSAATPRPQSASFPHPAGVSGHRAGRALTADSGTAGGGRAVVFPAAGHRRGGGPVRGPARTIAWHGGKLTAADPHRYPGSTVGGEGAAPSARGNDLAGRAKDDRALPADARRAGRVVLHHYPARRLKVTPGTASQHLLVLLEAGMVTAPGSAGWSSTGAPAPAMRPPPADDGAAQAIQRPCRRTSP